MVTQFTDLINKSHNATVPYPYVHISVLNSTLWDMEQMHCGICEIGLFWQALWPVVAINDYALIQFFVSVLVNNKVDNFNAILHSQKIGRSDSNLNYIFAQSHWKNWWAFIHSIKQFSGKELIWQLLVQHSSHLQSTHITHTSQSQNQPSRSINQLHVSLTIKQFIMIHFRSIQ